MAQDYFEERLAKMERRIRCLEERVAAQDRAIVEKRDTSYDEAEGGDGKNSDAFATLLSAEF